MMGRTGRLMTTGLLILLLGGAGCQMGAASFSGDLGGGRDFDPNGTVFTYVDGHDENYNSLSRPSVVVFMTWLIFNPNGDLNDLQGATLEDYRHELRLRDALSLVFADQTTVTEGTSFTSITEGTEEVGAGDMQAYVYLRPERLTMASTYSNFSPFGSRRQVTVDITQAGFVEGGVQMIAGDISIAIDRLENDPAETRTGQVEGTFLAPLVDERKAEQNLSLLSVDDILGVPLPRGDAS
jgi:hypothetical protein